MIESLSTHAWYTQIVKPEWAPPSWVFSPVWTVLYILIAVSFWYVVYRWAKKQVPDRVLLPFALNLVTNLLYPVIQFLGHNIPLATVDIVLVLGTLIWAMIAVWRYARWVSVINIPYLLWVAFATALQVRIFFLN